MPIINSTEFGSVTIDNKKYSQVLIVGNVVEERDYEHLKELFGTSHRIGAWETEKLLANGPEVIVIGTGQDGKLEVEQDFLKIVKESGAEVVVEHTPVALRIYNRLVKEGKRTSALIHTTC